MKKLLLLLTLISRFAFGQNNSPQYNSTTKKTTQSTGVVQKAPVWSATDTSTGKSSIFKFETGRIKFKNLATSTDTATYNKVLVLSGDSLRQMSRSYFGGGGGSATIDTTKVGRIEQGRGTAPIFMYFNGVAWVRNDTSYVSQTGTNKFSGDFLSNQSFFTFGLNSTGNHIIYSDQNYGRMISENSSSGIQSSVGAFSSSDGSIQLVVTNPTPAYSRQFVINGSNSATPNLAYMFDKGIAYYNGDYSAEMEASQNLIPSLKKVKQLISDSISGGGGSVNASNGLSLAGDTLKLGGTLNDTTIINTNNNTLTLAALSSDANKVVFSVTSDGYSILDVNNLGNSDLSLGFNAGINKTSGSENVIVGNRAVEDVSNIDYSNIQGSLAGNGCSSISESILNGYYSGSYVVSGSTLTGIRSGRLDTYGTYNSNLQGYYSGYSSKGFYGCNIFGYYGAVNLANAVPLRNSILLGNYTAENDNVNTTTGGIIHIGNYTHTGGFNNTIAIGDSATNTKTNQVVFAPKYRHLRIRGIDYELPASQGATDTYLKNDGSGVLTWATASGGSGTVTSVTSANTDISVANTTTTPVLTLNSGSGANQIVKRDGSGNLNATTVTTNANLTGVITSIGNATSITSQTGTGSTFAMSATPTFTTNITTPLIIGGTGTTSPLILRSTSGAGTTGSDIIFQNQTNGSNEPMRILSSGYVGIGTGTNIVHKLDVWSSTAGNGIRNYNTTTPSSISGGLFLGQSPLATAANQRQVTLAGGGYDGTNSFASVRIQGFSSEAQVLASNRGGYLNFETTQSGTITLVERMRITDAGDIGIGTTSPNSTLNVNGSLAQAYVAKTATYTATANDYLIDCTANTFTVTLPTAVGITGRIYEIVNSGAGTITVATTSSQTFVNVTATPTTLSLIAALAKSVRVMSNGANWIQLN